MRVMLGSSSDWLNGVITLPLLYLMLVFCIRPYLVLQLLVFIIM